MAKTARELLNGILLVVKDEFMVAAWSAVIYGGQLLLTQSQQFAILSWVVWICVVIACRRNKVGVNYLIPGAIVLGIVLLAVGYFGCKYLDEKECSNSAGIPPSQAAPAESKILKDGDFKYGDLKKHWRSSEPQEIGYISPDAATAGTITTAGTSIPPEEIFSIDYRFGRSGKCLWINNPNRTIQGQPHHLYQESIKVTPNTKYKVIFYALGEIKHPDSFWLSLDDLWINQKRIFDKPERFDKWTKKEVDLTTGDQNESRFWIIVNDEATNLRIDDITVEKSEMVYPDSANSDLSGELNMALFNSKRKGLDTFVLVSGLVANRKGPATALNKWSMKLEFPNPSKVISAVPIAPSGKDYVNMDANKHWIKFSKNNYWPEKSLEPIPPGGTCGGWIWGLFKGLTVEEFENSNAKIIVNYNDIVSNELHSMSIEVKNITERGPLGIDEVLNEQKNLQ